jgi:4-amino-4-deoxy-L-arabinose transferase-like glycosyltransferase
VAFSLLPQKQKHYMLPLLPALAILLADGVLASARLDAASFARTVRRLGFAAAAVVLLAFGLAVARESGREADAVPALLLVPIGLLLAVTLAAAARSGRPGERGGRGRGGVAGGHGPVRRRVRAAPAAARRRRTCDLDGARDRPGTLIPPAGRAP